MIWGTFEIANYTPTGMMPEACTAPTPEEIFGGGIDQFVPGDPRLKALDFTTFMLGSYAAFYGGSYATHFFDTTFDPQTLYSRYLPDLSRSDWLKYKQSWSGVSGISSSFSVGYNWSGAGKMPYFHYY